MKQVVKHLALLCALSFILLSCSQKQEFIIGSELRLPENFSEESEAPYYVYKTSYSQDSWEFLIQQGHIYGFEHEYGYEYRIEAKYHKGKKTGINVEEDNLTDYYVLIKVLAKEKRQSANLPGKRSPLADYGDDE